MLAQYMEKALEGAEYKKLDDDTWFAEIPRLNGVWATGATVYLHAQRRLWWCLCL